MVDQLIGGCFCAISNAVAIVINKSADDSITIGVEVEGVFPTEASGDVSRFPTAVVGDHTIGIGGPAIELIIARASAFQENLEAFIGLNSSDDIPGSCSGVVVSGAGLVLEGDSTSF